MPHVRIGTSGWHYQHWRGPYYPPSVPPRAMLNYYAREFDTVEVNNSFYRLPSTTTFDTWNNSTPAGFCFAVKASRFLTHRKKLLDPGPALERLMEATAGLEAKLGPILFQLPPNWHCNPDRLKDFLRALPTGRRYSIEFRDQSWHTLRVFDLLRKHNVAFCIYELGGVRSVREVTADFVYVRLHGPGSKYQGDYSTKTLKSWAAHIERWIESDRDVYVYFDNDQAGYAVKNAQELKRIIGREQKV
ncbi:MAG: DUF72 domain-containing protein [Nitrospira sp.]